LTFFSTGVMDGHDRNPVRRNELNSTTESKKNIGDWGAAEHKARQESKAGEEGPLGQEAGQQARRRVQ
jgi:hypothetical protein